MAEIEISINLDRDGDVRDVRADTLGRLRHTLDDPDSPVSRLHAGKQKKTDIDPNVTPTAPKLGMETVESTHLASVALPSEIAIGGKDSLHITDDQMACITRKHEIDAYTNGALSVLTPQKTKLDNTDHLKLIEQAVHAVMQEILKGTDILRIPPSEVFHLVDTLRDHAFAYANHCAGTGKPPCVETLKHAMRNHRDVKTFQRTHGAEAGIASDMNHHPKTGMPSRTIIAGMTQHHGHCESTHGHYHYSDMDRD